VTVFPRQKIEISFLPSEKNYANNAQQNEKISGGGRYILKKNKNKFRVNFKVQDLMRKFKKKNIKKEKVKKNLFQKIS